MADNNKVNRSTHVQFFKLCEELRNRREDLLKRKPTYTEVVEEMTTRLGFQVYIGSLQEALQAVGIEWQSPRGNPNLKQVHAELREVAESLDTFRREAIANISALRGLISHLYTKLGETPPPGLGLFAAPKQQILPTERKP